MDADLRHVVTPATNLTERALKSDGAGEMITVRVDEVWAFGRLVSYRNIQVRRPHLTDAQIDHIWNNR
jgi:hypothetical protein